ncbi:MAG: hypothetical protein Q9174_002461, partial [Haloplaca sp. 1 TL-2023]
MGFRQRFRQHQLPKWSSHYVDYCKLEELLTSVDQEGSLTEDSIEATKSTLQSELNKVESFYNSQFKALYHEEGPFYEGSIRHAASFTRNRSADSESGDKQLSDYFLFSVPVFKCYQDLHVFGYLNLLAVQQLGRVCYSDTLRPFIEREFKRVLAQRSFGEQSTWILFRKRLGDSLTREEDKASQDQPSSELGDLANNSEADDKFLSLVEKLTVMDASVE